VLASTLTALRVVPIEAVVVLLGVARFMSEARTITKLIGNGAATLVVARSENAFDGSWLTRSRAMLPQPFRGRAYLVRMRTRVKNRIHGYLTAENCRCLLTDLYGKAGRARLRAAMLPEISRLQVDLLLELVDALDERNKRLDQRVRTTVAQAAAAERLQTVPGIGPFGALLLLAEIGRIDRFASSHQLAACAGLVPSTRSSGDKTAHGGVEGAGSPWLKWILIEIVPTLKLAPGPIGMQYQRLLRSKGKAKATVSAARQLCCYLYWMLQEAWTYEEWLQQHEKLGVRPEQALVSVA
jgi:transposase